MVRHKSSKLNSSPTLPFVAGWMFHWAIVSSLFAACFCASLKAQTTRGTDGNPASQDHSAALQPGSRQTPIYANIEAIRDATTNPSELQVIPSSVLAKGTLVLHLPGIGGFRSCDRRMLSGLKDGGVDANLEMYDWTAHDPGLHALQALDRNQKQAQHVADMLVAHFNADPKSPIYLTGHSGGCGIAVFALEKLPADVMVDDVLLMAPALSPTYDLSAALKHVRGHISAFSSTHDVLVLYTGTRMFGTIDGVQTEAAGYGGFIRPAAGDAEQYKKLLSHPYEPDWNRLDNWGDHVGAMSRPFASTILAPLLHAPGSTPATRPSAPIDPRQRASVRSSSPSNVR